MRMPGSVTTVLRRKFATGAISVRIANDPMERREKIIVGLCALFCVAAGGLHFAEANAVLAFGVTAGALALLAVLVGDATEQLGSRLGPGATGILQSGLGNLPELFVCIFALRAGLAEVVQAALIGSILGNSVLVLGVALFVGGLKNGTKLKVSLALGEGAIARCVF